MSNKCQKCKYGGMNAYKMAIKKIDNKIIDIDYLNGDLGCRSSEDNDRQIECLDNNFINFEEFITNN